MYIIVSTMLTQRFYQENEEGHLVLSYNPTVYDTYDSARNAVQRTLTLCKKLEKHHLTQGVVGGKSLEDRLRAMGQSGKALLELHRYAELNGLYSFRKETVQITRLIERPIKKSKVKPRSTAQDKKSDLLLEEYYNDVASALAFDLTGKNIVGQDAPGDDPLII